MISEKFLKELGLSDEVVKDILAQAAEEEKKENFEKTIRQEMGKMNPYDLEMVLKLFDTTGLEYGESGIEGLEDRLLEFKEKYPFVFDKPDMPKIISPGNSGKEISAEEFKKMSYKERAELYKRNPMLYKKYLKH